MRILGHVELSQTGYLPAPVPTVESLEGRSLLSTIAVNLISENVSGTNGATLGASLASVSADGQYVAFESGSFKGTSTPAPSDLVHGLTVENNASNVYFREPRNEYDDLHQRRLQTGNLTGNDDSRYPIISANGDTVVFLSNATDLTANDNPPNNPSNDQTSSPGAARRTK